MAFTLSGPFDPVMGLIELRSPLRNARAELVEEIYKGAIVQAQRGVTAHDVIVKGLPGRSIEVVAALSGLSAGALAKYLDVPPKTLAATAARRRLPKGMSDRLARLLCVCMQAAETLEDPDYAADWLKEPNERLGYRTPRELVETESGARQVLDVLIAIEHGLPT